MSSLPKHIEDELQYFLELLVPNAILLTCLHVEHGEEQHLSGNSDLNVKATPFIHVKVKIEQGSRSGLGLKVIAHKEDLIRKRKLKNRRNSNLNVETTPLAHVKVEIEQGQGSKSGLGLDAEREDLIKNKELKNRGNSNLKYPKLNAHGENMIRNKELIKQTVAIPTPRPNVRIKIIDHIYVERYKKYLCFLLI